MDDSVPVRALTLEPKIPTERELRNYRKQFVTRVLPTVQGCVHPIDLDEMPHNHCDNCWFAFFSNKEDFIMNLHNVYKTQGKEALSRIYGLLFVKQFCRFMRTIADKNNAQI